MVSIRDFIAALKPQTRELILFDIKTKHWTRIADSITGDNLNWANDSQYLYVDTLQSAHTLIIQIRIHDKQRQTISDLTPLKKGLGQLDYWIGITPDNSPLILHQFTAAEVYAIECYLSKEAVMNAMLRQLIVNECRNCSWASWVLLFLLITLAITSGCSISNEDMGTGIGAGGDISRASGSASQSYFQSHTGEFDGSPDTVGFHKLQPAPAPAPSQPSPRSLPNPPNPVPITLLPKFSLKAPNRTVYYVSGYVSFSRSNSGCANPTITRVVNKSPFRIDLVYGPETNPIVGEALNPNQLTYRFTGYDAPGPWVALGPESGSFSGRSYVVKIEVYWACLP